MKLRLAGTSFADIARNLGVTRTSVSSCSIGRGRSHRIQSAIAKALSTTPQELFPERYEKDHLMKS
ncbi:helix-turn-helix domain-containing protein [Paenirhodobacter populi]|uniref:DNA-binding protein n=1 Tax=Paenirhodobacter populi TaxID=2306993 RepID=A0A443JN23_9RHOB|nr:helix-turn-helix domain-containing protein [Sinirhodobacter populi]RWR04358.1 DNA-binding protein [Sinirhodobacter populi]RWR21892.1 DNA-binding protein [Sinirhodobacter populi]